MRVEPRYLLLAMAGIWVFLGLWAMLSPGGMVALVELSAESPTALAEVRAMYGGLELALGGLLIWHAMDDRKVGDGLVIAGATVGGLGSARLLSQLLTGFTPLAGFFVVFELASAAVCLVFSRQA